MFFSTVLFLTQVSHPMFAASHYQYASGARFYEENVFSEK
jgi:hypothetical protein